MRNILGLILIFGFTIATHAQTPKHSETVQLNGLETYYEVYGEGPPLFFLHGGGQSVTVWHEYVEHFADNYEVYLVDLPGHGKSGGRVGELSYQLQLGSDQIQGLLDHFKLERVNAVGFSTGAGVLLTFAISDPDRIQRMIVVGVGNQYSPKGPGGVVIRVADEAFRSIATETLVVIGENDSVPGGSPSRSLQHAFRLHELLPNSHLWVVPNEGHLTFDGSGKPDFVRIANEFLSGEWDR